MAESLAGSAALVTGASSGIGEATARLLASRGAHVALVARRRDRLEQIAAEVRQSGGRALVIEADITDPEAAASAVEEAAGTLGRLDIVVNNAGLMLLGEVESSPVEEWERMMEINVMGLLYVSKAALPHLLSAADSGPRRVSDLVNVSSVAGRKAGPTRAVYNLTKFGVGAFSEALRQEVTARHVRVSLIEPGVVATELLSHLRPEVREQFMSGPYAQMEPLKPEDVAEAIEYVVTRPRRASVNELLMRPTEQVF
jgi:NADP-dependent 3-hydroxy acid dehydrogenase YdfG